MQDKIKLLQINLRKTRAATTLLTQFATENKIDIILAQDPFVKNNAIIGTPISWKCHLSTLQTAAIIITNTSLTYVLSKISENSIFINLTAKNNTNIQIGSQYSKPWEKEELEKDLLDWKDLLIHSKNLIIGGDYNARDELWGYNYHDNRGTLLKQYLMANRLLLINDPDSIPTYYTTNDNSGYPDLTLCSYNILNYVLNWHVLDTVERGVFGHLRYLWLCPSKGISSCAFINGLRSGLDLDNLMA